MFAYGFLPQNQIPQPNIAVEWDWPTAGFACFQPAPHLER